MKILFQQKDIENKSVLPKYHRLFSLHIYGISLTNNEGVKDPY